MNGQLISISESPLVEGYLAIPPAGSGPGVIVLQEWWGLVPHIKDVCDRLAEEGFMALAPDLWEGQVAEEPGDAEKLFMALELDRITQILASAADVLLADPRTTSSKLGVMGFCMGGQLALYAGCKQPKSYGAVVNFYGVHPKVQPDYDALEAPVLGNFAEEDDLTPPSAVAKLGAVLTEKGKSHDLKIYEGTDHAFFNDDRPEVYNREAAEDAWARTLQFLRANLS